MRDNMLLWQKTIPIIGTIAMNTETAMAAFVEVARAGGFSAAARKLGMSTTAVSRYVAGLEQQLGIALLRRTTRHVSPTEAGARYLPRAAAILDEIAELNAETSAIDAVPRGKLRVTVPPGVGNDLMARIAVDFVEAYPEIDLEFDPTERIVDLVAEGYDAAVRSGALPSSSLIAHKIIEMRYLVCGCPDYLSRRGTPARPEDVDGHDCIHWCGSPDGNVWVFSSADARVPVPIRARLMISNIAAARDAALRGLGLAILPLVSVGHDLDAGRLVPVLSDYEVRYGELYLVRPPTPFVPPKLRAFIDFMTAALRERANEGADW